MLSMTDWVAITCVSQFNWNWRIDLNIGYKEIISWWKKCIDLSCKYDSNNQGFGDSNVWSACKQTI